MQGKIDLCEILKHWSRILNDNFLREMSCGWRQIRDQKHRPLCPMKKRDGAIDSLSVSGEVFAP